MLYIKRHVLDIRILTGAYYKAADANHDGTVSSIDTVSYTHLTLPTT